MVMRLVRDDDYDDSPMTLDQEQHPPRHSHDSGNGDTGAESELVDAQDGMAIDTADEADDSDAPASDAPQVDLAPLEALLLSTHHPLTAGRLAELLVLDATKPLRKAIKALNEAYASTGRSFRIEQVAGGFQILTLPDHGDLLKKFHQKEIDAKLTKAAIETLAIIAYKQSILR